MGTLPRSCFAACLVRWLPNLSSQMARFAGAFEPKSGHLVEIRGEATGTAIDADVSNYGNGCGYRTHLDKNG